MGVQGTTTAQRFALNWPARSPRLFALKFGLFPLIPALAVFRASEVIGYGGFHFSSPDSVYAVAQQYRIPIFTVVLDNGGWQAVKSAVQRVYPKGVAAETDAFQSRLTSGRQGERRDFSLLAKAFGAHGECVTEPDELAAAIDRCLAALDDGQAAVLHVQITRL